jgi:hypothetical protein
MTTRLSRLRRVTGKLAHEPVAEILPGDALDRSRLQLRCTTLKLGNPDVFRLRIGLFKAVEQPCRHFSAVVFVQRQGLLNDFFDNSDSPDVSGLPGSPIRGIIM